MKDEPISVKAAFCDGDGSNRINVGMESQSAGWVTVKTGKMQNEKRQHCLCCLRVKHEAKREDNQGANTINIRRGNRN